MFTAGWPPWLIWLKALAVIHFLGLAFGRNRAAYGRVPRLSSTRSAAFGAPRFVWKPNIADNSSGGIFWLPNSALYACVCVIYLICSLVARSNELARCHSNSANWISSFIFGHAFPFSSNAFFLAVSLPFNFSFLLVLQLPEKELIANVLAVNIWTQKLTFHFNYRFIYSWYPQWLWLFILTSSCVFFQWNQIRAPLASDSPVFYLSQTAACVALAKGLLRNTWSSFRIFLQ